MATAIGAVIVALITGAFSVITTVLTTRKQQRQGKEIDALAFLVTHFLPRWELKHLSRLSRSEAVPYDKPRYPHFEHEVRSLRDRDLIEPKAPSFHVADLPAQGDLRDYFMLTPSGKTYLEILDTITAKAQGS